MHLFIFGAGSSIGGLGLPGVERFGRALSQHFRDTGGWKLHFPDLAKAVKDLPPEQSLSEDDWQLDKIWTRVDYFAKLEGILGKTPYTSASPELHRALATVFGDEAIRAVLGTSSGRKSGLRSIVRQVRGGDLVASFNWDSAVELLLVEQLQGSGTHVVQLMDFTTTANVGLVKPHGSLTWWRRHPPTGDFKEDVLWRDLDGGPRLRAIRPEEVDTWQPLVLGAVPIKSELIREVQACCRTQYIYDLVMGQWVAFSEGLRRADAITVVGYSFPPEDDYARFLVQEAAHKRSRPISSIELWEIESRLDEVRTNVANVLRVDSGSIIWRGPVDGL